MPALIINSVEFLKKTELLVPEIGNSKQSKGDRKGGGKPNRPGTPPQNPRQPPGGKSGGGKAG